MISIVIPARNEEKNIHTTLKRIAEGLKLDHEMIIVNDHSTDNTWQVLKSLQTEYKNLKPVENMNEPGIANAIKTGFDFAKEEFIVCMMADLCDDIPTITQMHEKILKGYDVVCGSRYIKGGARLGGSRLKAFFSWFVGKSLKILICLPTSDAANAFKMYRKNVLDNIHIESKGFEMSVEIMLKAYFKGYRITEVPTIWRERTEGESHFNIVKLGPQYFKWYFWGIMKGFKKCFIR